MINRTAVETEHRLKYVGSSVLVIKLLVGDK